MKTIRIFCVLATLQIFVGSLTMFSGHVWAASSSPHQFVADVNGDGKADAVTFDKNTGDWWVAVSNGSSFSNVPSRWLHGFGVGSSKQLLGDVNGDGAADAVTFDAKTGDWWVAVSNASNSFSNTPSRWMNGHGVGSKNQLLGDVNGDGKADAVVFFDNGPGFSGPQLISGAWYVATSNIAGNHFDPPGNWFIRGHGVGSTNQFVADVDGDGKADAVAFFGSNGAWWVSNSDSRHFATGPNQWSPGWGSNSPNQLMNDVDGDGRADAFIADAPYGNHNFAALSNGTTFSSTIDMSGAGAGDSGIFLADPTGGGKADVVVFDKNTGDWWVAISDGSRVSSPGRWLSGFGVGT